VEAVDGVDWLEAEALRQVPYGGLWAFGNEDDVVAVFGGCSGGFADQAGAEPEPTPRCCDGNVQLPTGARASCQPPDANQVVIDHDGDAFEQ
jgi:hypothetical protein